MEIENAIDHQRRELATAMTLLHCLHCVLRRETDYTSPDESEVVENAVGWVELPDVTSDTRHGMNEPSGNCER
jgi:hypothetical protein